ncbi:hypothetical protein [Amycolatopsis rubida]|uniref:hypothetical protein n=1 Tax=Amycolatopsis rubida TaxID=112413 RepID=UPI0011602052|nr:hypothetical protein [Amycolatopsis rubida]
MRRLPLDRCAEAYAGTEHAIPVKVGERVWKRLQPFVQRHCRCAGLVARLSHPGGGVLVGRASTLAG